MMAIYNHYTVTKFKVTYEMHTSSNTNLYLVTSFVDDDDMIFVSNGETVRENVTSMTQSVNPTLFCTPPMSRYWSAAKAFGGNVVDNADLRGTVNVNPFEGQTFFLYVEGTPTDVLTFRVRITYTVVWSELKLMAGS